MGRLSIDVSIEGAERPVALIGPNGSGKTTFLRTMVGGYRPTAGVISIGEDKILDTKAGLSLPPEERKIGYVPQGMGLFPHLNVVENVAFGTLVERPRRTREERHEQAMAYLAQLQCEHLARRMPRALSGGEQQRVALARALMVEPRLLLLDEPLSALDIPSRRTVRKLLAGYLQRKGIPVLLVTHDVRNVRAFDAKVVVLEEGRVIQTGSVEEVAAAPANEFVSEFFVVD